LISACGPAVKTLPTIPISPTTTIEDDGNPNSVIPLPNSGRAPQQPGDRGGWMQITLFFLVIAAMGVIFILIGVSTTKRTRRKKREAGLVTTRRVRRPRLFDRSPPPSDSRA
jgi:hypothetical protein